MNNQQHRHTNRYMVGGGLYIDPRHRRRKEDGERFPQVIRHGPYIQPNGRHGGAFQDANAVDRIRREADSPIG